jgi:hypothetical protein
MFAAQSAAEPRLRIPDDDTPIEAVGQRWKNRFRKAAVCCHC